jgi:hypothetical protein
VTTPQAISEITDPDPIRIKLYASNQEAHAPLIEAVRAGANGRLLPDGGDAGDVLTKASAEDYDVVWSRAIGLRAFANIDGTTAATVIREQFNVASVVENSTGNYTVTWDESISSTPAVTITCGDTVSAGVYVANIVAMTTTTCNFQVRTDAGTLTDCDTICIIVAGLFSDFLLTSGDMQAGDDKVELSGDEAPGVERTSGQE